MLVVYVFRMLPCLPFLSSFGVFLLSSFPVFPAFLGSVITECLSRRVCHCPLSLILTMLLAILPLLATTASAQVTATGPNGPTNPSSPGFAAVGSTVNQNSNARLLTVNSIDDFCLYAPQNPNSVIGNEEENVVAWCTKPRNNAR